MGLPQRVAAPPPSNIFVDDGHEVDRLAGGPAQTEEERDVRGMKDVGLDLGIDTAESVDRRMRIVGRREVGEHRRHRPRILRVHTRLGTLQHLDKPLLPGDVGPRVLIGATIPDGQRRVAVEPFAVGHGVDVAEVGLGSRCHRGDDLVTAFGHRVGVARHLVEESAAARRGIVDLVDVGAELASARGHSVCGTACADPLVDTLGVDEQLLDLRRRGGLGGGHGRGADQDAVERHGGITVPCCPFAGQVLTGALGRTDAATDADDDVVTHAQLGVGGEQQVVEVFP